MNNVFENNINALKFKDAHSSELAEKLKNHALTSVPQLVRENNFYNFIYKEKYLHNPINPLGEAVEIFSMAENTPVTIHFIYGMGLGYLFQIASF